MNAASLAVGVVADSAALEHFISLDSASRANLCDVAELRLDQLHVARAGFDSPPADGKHRTAPVSLALPIDLQVARLTLDALQIDDLPAVSALRGAVVLGANGGREATLLR